MRTAGEDKVLALTSVSDTEVGLDGTGLMEALCKGEARDLISEQSYAFNREVKLAPYQTLWLK
jgi:hypothetical protein